MPDDDARQQLIATVYDLWSRSNAEWPMFAQVDKRLDVLGVDAEAELRDAMPRYVQARGASQPPAPDAVLALTVPSLARLPEAANIARAFMITLDYLILRESEHEPTVADLAPEVTSRDVAAELSRAAPGFGSNEVIARLAECLGGFLQQEGHLWTQISTPHNGSWQVRVSRGVRQFRDVQDLPAYVDRVDTIRGTAEGRMVFADAFAAPSGTLEPSEANVPDPRKVFVIHGRNEAARRGLFDFLRALKLEPIEWSEAISMTGQASPYVGDVLDAAFDQAQAVLVLQTPDDIAYLQRHLADGSAARIGDTSLRC